MLRKFITPALAAALLLTLCGCESGQSTSSTSASASTSAADANVIRFIALETDDAYSIALEGSEHAAYLMEHGKLETPVAAVGAQRNGKKVYGPDEQTLAAFLGEEGEGDEPVTTAAFVTAETADAFYVARADSDAARHLQEHGELESPVAAVGTRIRGKKVYGADEATLAAFLGW